MGNNTPQSDKITIKRRKGMWLRFIKLFIKCKLPWVWVAAYLILDISAINFGLDETDLTAQLFAGDTSVALVVKLITIIIVNLVLTSMVVFMRGLTSARINRNMRSALFDKVMRLPMSYFKNENPREAMYRITSNAEVIDSTIMFFVIPMFSACYSIIKIIDKIFKYDWRLSVILLAFVPIQIIVAFIFGRINFSLSRTDHNINAGLTQKLAELVTNIPLAKAFAKENKESEKGKSLTERLYKINIKSSWLDQVKNLSETFINLIQAGIMCLVGVFLLGTEEITVRKWVAFYMFSGVFSGAVSELLIYWNNIKVIQGGADRVAEIMDAKEEPKGGIPCEKLSGDINIESLTFGYDEDKPVLNDFSCVFPDNTVTALLGVSGCGKTTLTSLIMRLYEPTKGRLVIGNEDTAEYELQSYRDNFVMVSQNSMLFSGTVRDNVTYGCGDVAEDKILTALKQAGAYDFVQNMNGGLDAAIEEYGNNLSGGQRQRLAVARALLSDAHYIIFDEPAAAMDAVAANELCKVLKEVVKDRCCIVIAHSKNILPIAQRAVVIDNGKVAAEGSMDEVIKTNDFVRCLMNTEVESI